MSQSSILITLEDLSVLAQRRLSTESRASESPAPETPAISGPLLDGAIRAARAAVGELGQRLSDKMKGIDATASFQLFPKPDAAGVDDRIDHPNTAAAKDGEAEREFVVVKGRVLSEWLFNNRESFDALVAYLGENPA